MVETKFSDKTVKELKSLVDALEIKAYPKAMDQLLADPRASVKAMGNALAKKIKALEKEKARIVEMKALENSYYEKGIKTIAGIDEVGRGPLAGPVVSCAVILKKESQILYVNDSKKLSKKKREELCTKLLKEAVAYEIGAVEHDVIDAINIFNATKEAMLKGVRALKIIPDLLLIDAMRLDCEILQCAVIHGDARSYSIAAASIIAKVFRDNVMMAYHEIYPNYGFNHNMGYGTAEHVEAIKKFGLTPIHRRSFVKNLGY